MATLYDRIDKKIEKDLRVLFDFVEIFCRENHRDEPREPFAADDANLRAALGDRDPVVCADCRKLLQHGISKRIQCPYDPKPMCKKCPTHCYAPGYRERMRQVMRFSGLYLVKRGRLDMVFHYLF
ncbi:MAG: nitrous oxide-stimulated promoter family protein [Dehalococcoidales bacterium]